MPELEYLRRTHSAEDHDHSNCPCLSIAQYLKERDFDSDDDAEVIDHINAEQEECVSPAVIPAIELDSEQVSSLFDKDQITFLHRIQEDPDAVYSPQRALEGAEIDRLNTELFGNFKEVADKAITARQTSDGQRKRLAHRGRRRVPAFLVSQTESFNHAGLERLSGSANVSPRARLVVSDLSDDDIEPPLPFEAELKLSPPPRRSCSSPYVAAGLSGSEPAGRKSAGSNDVHNLLKIVGGCALAFAIVTWTLILASASIKHNQSEAPDSSSRSTMATAAPRSLYEREQIQQEQIRQEQLLQQQLQQQQIQEQYRAAANSCGYRSVNTSIYLPTTPAPVYSTPAPTYVSETRSIVLDKQQQDAEPQQGPNIFGWFLGLLFLGAAAWGLISHLATTKSLLMFLAVETRKKLCA